MGLPDTATKRTYVMRREDTALLSTYIYSSRQSVPNDNFF